MDGPVTNEILAQARAWRELCDYAGVTDMWEPHRYIDRARAFGKLVEAAELNMDSIEHEALALGGLIAVGVSKSIDTQVGAWTRQAAPEGLDAEGIINWAMRAMALGETLQREFPDLTSADKLSAWIELRRAEAIENSAVFAKLRRIVGTSETDKAELVGAIRMLRQLAGGA